jgi:hypothetical protein
MAEMKFLDWVTIVLLIVGGLNWGLYAFFDYNIVDKLFGIGSTVAKVIYGLVLFSALYGIVFIVKELS